MAEHFYFAWVDEGETFDPDVHAREDEDVFSFELTGSEGDFDGLSLDIKNPRIGLLNPARKVWGILSFFDGSTVVPLFRGRLVGVPTNLFATIVTITFVARPPDFNDQKQAIADTLMVLPYYDPIFVKPESWGDPDTVLEAYSRLWHIDPVTNVVSTTDFLVGEDGTEEVTEDQHFYDDMEVTLNTVPARSVSMTATIPWAQSADGGLSLTRRIWELWGLDVLPSSFTMPGLIDDWPKPGSDFGSGWQVLTASMTDVSYRLPRVTNIPEIFSWQGVVPIVPIGSMVFPLKIQGEFHSGETAGYNFNFELVIASRYYAVPELTVTFKASRDFAQVVTFTLYTDQQNVVTLPGDDEALSIALNANPVSDFTLDGSLPIGDVRRRSYIHTERGLQSIEHLLLVARAHLIAKSRAVETKFVMGFKDALRLKSLRKNALLHDHRLPGGQAVGKIVAYRFSLDGDQGSAIGEITIGSSVGYGGSYSTVPGNPTYVDEGYVDQPYQEYANEIRLTDTADIQWTVPTFSAFDDKIDFLKGLNDRNAVLQCFMTNGPEQQKDAIFSSTLGIDNTDQARMSSVLQTIPTKITVQLVPMEGGPFTQEAVISVSDLIVPKQIDLEAASNA